MNYRDETVTHYRGIPIKALSRDELIEALQTTLAEAARWRSYWTQPRSERYSF